jgi:hypothetical protein
MLILFAYTRSIITCSVSFQMANIATNRASFQAAHPPELNIVQLQNSSRGEGGGTVRNSKGYGPDLGVDHI